jgi:GNAT superfamily N-acetyltransferase
VLIKLRRHRLRVSWFDAWHPVLEQALAGLPEMDGCPHELYRTLLENRTGDRKRIALVMDRGCPVAVIGLRRRASDWVPVTHYLLPGAVFPVQDGYFIPALTSLHLDVWVALWRASHLLPDARAVRYIETTPTFGAPLTGDFERHWRQSGQLKNVKCYRKRCKDFTLGVDVPGSAEWTIRNAESKWKGATAVERLDRSDRLLVVHYLQDHERYHSLTLEDGGAPVAGTTLIVHGRDVVWHFTYRLEQYDFHGVGHRLMELAFRWAADRGFDSIDLGGDYAHHKSRWAPQSGAKYTLHVCPAYVRYAHQATELMHAVQDRVLRHGRSVKSELIEETVDLMEGKVGPVKDAAAQADAGSPNEHTMGARPPATS